MLSEWLQYDPEASWEKLAGALTIIGKNVIAANIRSQRSFRQLDIARRGGVRAMQTPSMHSTCSVLPVFEGGACPHNPIPLKF